MSTLLKVALMSWWRWHFCLVGHMTVGKKSRNQIEFVIEITLKFELKLELEFEIESEMEFEIKYEFEIEMRSR